MAQGSSLFRSTVYKKNNWRFLFDSDDDESGLIANVFVSGVEF